MHQRFCNILKTTNVRKLAIILIEGGRVTLKIYFTTILFLSSFIFPAFAEDLLSYGFCGDNIVNGNENCDGQDIPIRECSLMGGTSGQVRCKNNCVYDISDCIKSSLPGTAEYCKCNSDGEYCDGGCTSLINGESDCTFVCDGATICSCEGRLEAVIDRCQFSCDCANKTNGPDCNCRMKDCDLISAIR